MKYGNLYTAMITPFDENMEVDYEQVHRLAKHLVDNGSDGIVIAGTTGESPALSSEERKQLVLTVRETVGNQIDVILGAGTNTTAGTIEMVKEANSLGIDGIMLVVPYYNKPSQDGLYEHFKRAVSYTDRPVILYNIPGRTGCNMTAETICRLAGSGQVAGVKEASGNLNQITEIRMNAPDDFLIYSGDDAMTLPVLSLGGHGVISVASHIVGSEIAEMIQCWKDGDTDQAMNIHLRLYPIFKALFLAPNPAPVKYALGRYGFDTNRLRLPMRPIGNTDQIILNRILDRMGIKK